MNNNAVATISDLSMNSYVQECKYYHDHQPDEPQRIIICINKFAKGNAYICFVCISTNLGILMSRSYVNL